MRHLYPIALVVFSLCVHPSAWAELCSQEKNGVVTITSKGCDERLAKRPSRPDKSAKIAKRSKKKRSGKFKRYLKRKDAKARFLTTSPPPFSILKEIKYLSGPKPALSRLNEKITEKSQAAGSDPFVVVHYGDSHSRAGSFARTLRGRLSKGPYSPGYMSYQFPVGWNARLKKSSSWRRQNWLRNDIPPYGPLGIAFVATDADETLQVLLTDKDRPEGKTNITVFYHRADGHRRFRLEAGGRTLASIRAGMKLDSGKGGAPWLVRHGAYDQLAAVKVSVPADVKTLTLRTGEASEDEAPIRILGFLTQYETAGIEWDVLAIGGTSIDSVMKRSDEAIEAYLAHRKPDMMLIWYGTNSLNKHTFDAEKYGRRYRAFIDRMARAAPQAVCLAMGPTEFMKRDRECFLNKAQRAARKSKNSRKKWRILRENKRKRVCNPDDLINHDKRGRYRFPIPDILTMADWNEHKKACEYEPIEHTPAMVEIQKEIAHKAGCLYFDTFKFMGGRGAIKRMACDEKPYHAMLDLVHLTRDGYRHLGHGVADALDALTRTLDAD